MKGKRLTIKQRRFVHAYIKSGNGTRAIMETYDSKSRESAKHMAQRNLDNPLIQQEITKVMNESGMTLTDNTNNLRKVIEMGIDSGRATADTALRGIVEVFKLHNAYPAHKSLKLSLNRTEQVASKDMQAVVDELKKLTTATNSLVSSME